MFEALRSARSAMTIMVMDGHAKALEFLGREGEFENRASPDPDVIVLDASVPDGVEEFLSCARSTKESKPCPIVALSPGVDADELQRWYRAGVHSVLSTDPAEIQNSLGSISWYWLTHNRTPKLR